MKQNPEFIVFVGPMFSGKSTALLRELNRCKFQGKKTIAFKPVIDNRYSDSEIITHDGEALPAHSISSVNEIYALLASEDAFYDVLALDEAFMLPDVANVLTWLFGQGMTILVAGLDLSASGKPFEEIVKMMPWATKIEKFKAICAVCKEDASYTYKKNTDSDLEIEIGGSDLYEPRCWRCHPLINKRDG